MNLFIGDRFSGGARGGYQGNRDNQGFQSPYYNYYYPSAYGYYDYMNPYYQGYQAYGGGGGGGYSGGYYGRGSAGPGMASMPGGAGGDPYQGQGTLPVGEAISQFLPMFSL